MKRSSILILIAFAIFIFLFIQNEKRATSDDVPNGANNGQNTQTITNEDKASDDQRSVTRVIGGVSEKEKYIQAKPIVANQSKKQDDFIIKVISEKWLDKDIKKAGRRRVRIVEANFKYPNIRLEEQV